MISRFVDVSMIVLTKEHIFSVSVSVSVSVNMIDILCMTDKAISEQSLIDISITDGTGIIMLHNTYFDINGMINIINFVRMKPRQLTNSDSK